MTKSIVVIPARFASTRLPQKMLLRETGKPLIQYAYEAAVKATLPSSVCVACDHPEIAAAVSGFGGIAHMTNPNAASGTDRIAEVAATCSDADIVVNVQGDEPDMTPDAVDAVIQLLLDNPDAVMATLAVPIRTQEILGDPACVKVVFDQVGKALYFSRSVIPYPRGGVTDEMLQQNPPLFYLHLGIYAYRRDFLLSLCKLPQSPAEKLESLEQLRVLHHGHSILVGIANKPMRGIDTPEDYAKFVEKCRNN
ncbi:MAG: 3-deoxy-manno-octulosonate cytidylyltransferase [Thermoguttaceae bacterium]